MFERIHQLNSECLRGREIYFPCYTLLYLKKKHALVLEFKKFFVFVFCLKKKTKTKHTLLELMLYLLLLRVLLSVNVSSYPSPTQLLGHSEPALISVDIWASKKSTGLEIRNHGLYFFIMMGNHCKSHFPSWVSVSPSGKRMCWSIASLKSLHAVIP